LFDTNISGTLGGILSGSISGGYTGTLSLGSNQDILLIGAAILLKRRRRVS